MQTGFAAMRFGWSLMVIPVLFVFSPTLLLIGDPFERRAGHRHRDGRRLAHFCGACGLLHIEADTGHARPLHNLRSARPDSGRGLPRCSLQWISKV